MSRGRADMLTTLILEAAEAGRLSRGGQGVLLDGKPTDEFLNRDVIDFIAKGWLSETDGRITRGPGYVLEGETR